MREHILATQNKISIIQHKNTKRTLECYLMLSTQIIGFLVFSIYPMMWAIQKSWYFYTGAKLETRFVGWENFIKIFTIDKLYWESWITTLEFAVFKLPIELPLAMLLAVILNRKLQGRDFFRAMYYLPNIISVAIIGLVFTNIFDFFGIANAMLMKTNLIQTEIDWFANKNTAMIVLLTGSIWSSFGINVLYFLAALQNIPSEVYESAYLDGASRATIFFKITLPMIAPVLQTILLLSISGTLQVNDYILVTTNGAPGGSTYTVMSYIVGKFVPGFADVDVNIGYGCALSVITSGIMCFIAVFYSKISKKLQNIY